MHFRPMITRRPGRVVNPPFQRESIWREHPVEARDSLPPGLGGLGVVDVGGVPGLNARVVADGQRVERRDDEERGHQAGEDAADDRSASTWGMATIRDRTGHSSSKT